MKIFYIDTLGDLRDQSLCVLDGVPEGIGLKYSFLVKGRELSDSYPENAAIRMSDDREGIKLASLIGNTNRFLIVNTKIKEIIENKSDLESKMKIEYLPVSIINHKNKVHSDDYFIINPVGYIDVVDYDLSVINYFKDKVLSIKRLILDETKIELAPVIFRIKEDPTKYFMKDILTNAINEGDFSNIKFIEVVVNKE